MFDTAVKSSTNGQPTQRTHATTELREFEISKSMAFIKTSFYLCFNNLNNLSRFKSFYNPHTINYDWFLTIELNQLNL